MINENFVILGVLIYVAGGLSYLVTTIKGRTQPNRVTWFFWALAPLIAFAAEIGEGVGIQSLMTFIIGFLALLIFLASFINKQSFWKLSRFDFFCGALSLIGLLLWYFTKNGNLAILFAIFADIMASIPTIRKAHSFPETENYYDFLGATINAGITILTIKVWNFATFGFPIYIFITDLTLVLLVKFKIGKLIQSRIRV